MPVLGLLCTQPPFKQSVLAATSTLRALRSLFCVYRVVGALGQGEGTQPHWLRSQAWPGRDPRHNTNQALCGQKQRGP